MAGSTRKRRTPTRPSNCRRRDRPQLVAATDVADVLFKRLEGIRELYWQDGARPAPPGRNGPQAKPPAEVRIFGIRLDIARLALKDTVRFAGRGHRRHRLVPAFKFARREAGSELISTHPGPVCRSGFSTAHSDPHIPTQKSGTRAAGGAVGKDRKRKRCQRGRHSQSVLIRSRTIRPARFAGAGCRFRPNHLSAGR